MEKTRILGISVVILFAMNLLILGWLYFGHRLPHRKEPREIIIERLHFDQKQQQDYDKLILVHRQQVGQLESDIRDAKNKLYLQLLSEVPDAKIKDSLTTKLGRIQRDIENVHFSHFQHIKKICRHEQYPEFNALTVELSRLFSHPPPDK